jgi:hypothetical protein
MNEIYSGMRNVQNALRMPLLGVTYKILNRPAKALCFRRVRSKRPRLQTTTVSF